MSVRLSVRPSVRPSVFFFFVSRQALTRPRESLPGQDLPEPITSRIEPAVRITFKKSLDKQGEFRKTSANICIFLLILDSTVATRFFFFFFFFFFFLPVASLKEIGVPP